jgi:secreted trypsin-like serine protease
MNRARFRSSFFFGLWTPTLALGLIVLALLTLTSCSHDYDPATPYLDLPENRDSQIRGGQLLPMDAVLRKSTVGIIIPATNMFCTGTLISPRLVMTAAHCVFGANQVVIPLSKEFSVSDPIAIMSDSSTMISDKISVHPDYVPAREDEPDNFDIAVIYLPREIPSTHQVAPIAPVDLTLNSGTELKIVGIGVSSFFNPGSWGPMRAANVKIKEKLRGQSEFITDQSSGSGACSGDSGGPAYILVADIYYIYGIASRVNSNNSNPCSGDAIYTLVSAHRSFIENSELSFSTRE